MSVISLFKGPMRQHINGHKDLSDHGDIKAVKAGKEVKIPLYATHSANFDVLVKEGDHVCVGTKLAQCNDRMIVPIYSSVSGTVKGTAKILHATLKPVEHIVIENDDQYETTQAFAPLDYLEADKAELVEFVKNAGIVGCGGACFPTYIKYASDAKIDTLIINAVECEPYITSDYKMLNEYLDDMLYGIQAMRKMAGNPEVLIAIKETKKEMIAVLEKAVEGDRDHVSVAKVPDVYPMGWEKTLVQQLLKKTYNKLPSEVGAIVNNASTAITLGQALKEGTPLVEKIVTVSGDAVKHPCNVRVRIGTPVHEIMEAIGGYTCEDVKLISGGPMMGKTIVNDQFVIDRAVNALTVLENKPLSSVACLRCGSCSDHCPSGLQPVRIAQALNANDPVMMERLSVLDCVECGLCSYVCPSRLDVTENMRKAKRLMMLKAKK